MSSALRVRGCVQSHCKHVERNLAQRRPSQEPRHCLVAAAARRPSCRWCALETRRRRLARDGLRLRGLTGTMDIRMVRHRWIRRRILCRGNRLDFHETDYDPNDSTFFDHHPALLDQTVETQEGDTSKLETVQEAVAAANAAADMRRRTWTRARQLMKDVHRSRGHFPVSKGNMMEVDQGKGKSRGKKGRSSKGKGKRQNMSKGKGNGRRPGPCLLCQVPHWARDRPSHHGGKGEGVNSCGKGHKNSSPFRQAYLKGDKHDWITGAGVFLEPQCPWDASICCREFKKCTHRPVFNSLHIRVTLRFSFANGQENVSTSVLPVPYLPWKVIFYMRVLNAPGPVLLRADVHEDLGLVVDHVDCSVFLSHLKLDDTVERLPSRHLALSLCAEDVNAQYEALTPETRERLNHVL